MDITKRYTLGEEIANALTHGIGAALSIAAIILLCLRAAGCGALTVTACVIYGVSLLILYTMSTLYHALSNPKTKKVFRIFDHATIFLLIAGTYTPYALLTVRGTAGWVLFGVVWGLAIIGITFDAIMLERFRKIEMVLYVLMGWCIVWAGKTVLAGLALPGVILLFLGGVCYTAGILFYALKIRYMHSIWHLFVLGGSVLQFLSILLYVL